MRPLAFLLLSGFLAFTGVSAQESLSDPSAASRNIALQLLAEARDLASKVEGEHQRGYLLASIAAAEAHAHEFERARSTAEAAAMEGYKGQAFSFVAHMQAQAGALDDATRTLAEISEREWQVSWDLAMVAMQQAASGDTEGALHTVSSISDVANRALAIAMIAEQQAEHGFHSQASANFAFAASLVSDVRNPGRRADVLYFLAELQAPHDRLGALKALSLAVEALRARAEYHPSFSHASSRAELFSRIAVLQKESGDPLASKSTLQLATEALSKEDSFSRGEAHASVSAAFVEMGDMEGAITLAAGLSDQNLREAALLGIAIAQLKEGDSNGALSSLAGFRQEFSHAWFQYEHAVAEYDANRKSSAYLLLDKGREAAKKIEDRDCRESVLQALATGQAAMGDFDGAFTTSGLIASEDDKAQTLSQLMRFHSAAGGHEVALARARAETAPLIRAHALLGVAQGILERRLTKEAPETTLQIRSYPQMTCVVPLSPQQE